MVSLIFLCVLMGSETIFAGTMRDNGDERGAFFEGDIRLPLGQRNGLVDTTKRWPKNATNRVVVPYTINNVYTIQETTMIAAAMAEIQNKTCVSYKQRTTETDYLIIGNSTKAGESGCWSYLGRIGGAQRLNLQTQSYCFDAVGVPIHELTHALGFTHEHNREDRDNYVTINWQNIIAGVESNFQKAPNGTTTAFGVAYDYGSVLHYSAYAGSKNGQPTIVTKTGASIGQRKELSASDAEKIKRMYKC